MKNKCVIFFDFDGTIVNTMASYFFHYNQYAAANNKRLLDKALYETFREKTLSELRLTLGLNLIEALFLYRKLKNKVYSDPYKVPVIPGMVDLLKELHKHHCRLYIISSSSKKHISEVLKANNVGNFGKIIHTFRSFKKTFFIKRCLLENRGYSKAVLISDEYKDIQSANKLNIVSIAVTWGANNFNKAHAALPDYVVDNAAQINSILKEVCNLHMD